MAKLIKEDGKTRMIEPQTNGKFSIEELREHVGGTVLAINLGKSQYLCVNEQAILIGKQPNKKATKLAGDRIPSGDQIYGDAVHLQKREARL